jgi:hypothetical protein
MTQLTHMMSYTSLRNVYCGGNHGGNCSLLLPHVPPLPLPQQTLYLLHGSYPYFCAASCFSYPPTVALVCDFIYGIVLKSNIVQVRKKCHKVHSWWTWWTGHNQKLNVHNRLQTIQQFHSVTKRNNSIRLFIRWVADGNQIFRCAHAGTHILLV